MKSIAKKLNLSISTVSRAVNNKPNIKESTRKQILKALDECNYVPNEIARSLQSSSSNTIGVIIPDISEAFFGGIIKGIDEVVFQEGYTLIVADSNEDRAKEGKHLDMLFQKRVDALVLATVEPNGEKVNQYIDAGVPVVFIDNLPIREESVDAVMIDNIKASRIAVGHLLSLGHKDIAVIIGSIEETTGHDRLLGYKLALQNANIEVNERLIEYGNYKEDTGFDSMDRLIKNRKEFPFTAVYVTSEMMTFGAVKSLKKNDLKVPEDISLVGFDVHDRTELISPTITTIKQPEKMIGKQAGNLLIQRLEEKGSEATVHRQRILLDPIFEIKESSSQI
jgi:DNA-binding LacI/PurR family transcriptional regulator